MLVAEDEDPVDGPEYREQQVADERLPERAWLARIRVDDLHAEPLLGEALATVESVGEEIVEECPRDTGHDQERAKAAVERRQDPTHDQRRAGNQSVEKLSNETRRA